MTSARQPQFNVRAVLQHLVSWTGFLGLALVLVIAILRRRYRKGLRKIPGPFLASFLSTDRVITAASGNQHNKHIEYHVKYGPLVRVGPNHVSIARGEYISQLYGAGAAYPKSEFYSVFDAVHPNGGTFPTMFSMRNETAHRALKRPVANAYSMSSMVELEPVTDSCIKILAQKLESLQNQTIDLGEWLHWYSFDVIMSITFSHTLGFMDQEKDVDSIIEAIEGRLIYNSIIGQIPSLHKFLLGNRVVAWVGTFFPSIARLASSSKIVAFAATQLGRYSSTAKLEDDPKDLLSRFKRFRNEEPTMSDADVLSHASTSIFAGSDTTAISLRSMFYYLCKNRQCYDRLTMEIDKMNAAGKLSETITFAEASQMDYLQACMKEAMRMHPAVGQLLERVTPAGGANLGDVWVPPGTIVGVNPWVVARGKSVYGEDADQYRPERWLNNDPATLKAMNRNYLAFGSGGRSCLGKNVSLLEMSKLVPQLLRHFHVELSNPSAEWDLKGYWFVKQTNLLCRFRRRDAIVRSGSSVDC